MLDRREQALPDLLEQLVDQGVLGLYERQFPVLYGTADAAVSAYRLVVQADGGYGHGHLAGSRDDARVRATIGEDLRRHLALAARGWQV